MDKPKIHVFLGAPHPSSLPEESPERVSCHWKTVELQWSHGSLCPRTEIGESKTHCKYNRATTSEDQGCMGTVDAAEAFGSLLGSIKANRTVCRSGLTSPVGQSSGKMADVAEAIDRWKPANHHEKQSSCETDDVASEDGITPSVCHPSMEKPVHSVKDNFYSGVVTEYLDGCFPSQQPGPASDHVTTHTPPNPALSVETEYLTIWTKSQGLLLRSCVVKQPDADALETPRSLQSPLQQTPSASVGSPDLYSPEVSPGQRGMGGTLQGSFEVFYGSLSQRHQEGGVVLEHTSDGFLCSQDSLPDQAEVAVELNCDSSTTSLETSPTPSTSKRAKLSPTVSKNQPKIGEKHVIPLYGPTTLLFRCSSHGVHYSILVAVVHPCHLKEIKVKSGASAGSSVPLASVIVTDQSGVEMKVVLWRRAAFWALTVCPGDILLITGVSVHVDKWRGETVLQTSNISQLLNLGQVTQDQNPQAPHNLNVQTLRTLCTHLRETRPLLVSLPPHTTQDLRSISFIRLISLRPDTLVHAVLRVKHTRTIAAWRDEAEGISRSGVVLKAVLNVEQGDGSQGAVVLWGSALAWLQRFPSNKDAVWEFRLLLVQQDVTSGLLELHSTPWSSCQPLLPDDTRCREFYNTTSLHKHGVSFEIDLHTLLSQKYTGDVELRVQIVGFQFQSSPSQEAMQPMDREMSLERILEVVCGDITFHGCGLCCAELETDENGIYRLCYPCLPHTGVRHYYRPAVLTVTERERKVCVQVPPVLVEKILLNTPPDKLNKPVAPAADDRFVHVVAKRIHSILSVSRTTHHLTIRSHFDCDENSIPIAQNFLLLDFKSQEELRHCV